MSAETCIPVDWGRLIPPCLHLILGLVNDKVHRTYKELLPLGGIDEEAAQRLSDLTVVAAEVEDELIDQAEGVLETLTTRNPFVASTFGSTPNLGKCASKTSPLVRGVSSQMKPSRKPQRALLQEQLWPLGR